MSGTNCFFQDVISDLEDARNDKNSAYSRVLSEICREEFSGVLTEEQIDWVTKTGRPPVLETGKVEKENQTFGEALAAAGFQPAKLPKRIVVKQSPKRRPLKRLRPQGQKEDR